MLRRFTSLTKEWCGLCSMPRRCGILEWHGTIALGDRCLMNHATLSIKKCWKYIHFNEGLYINEAKCKTKNKTTTAFPICLPDLGAELTVRVHEWSNVLHVEIITDPQCPATCMWACWVQHHCIHIPTANTICLPVQINFKTFKLTTTARMQ